MNNSQKSTLAEERRAERHRPAKRGAQRGNTPRFQGSSQQKRDRILESGRQIRFVERKPRDNMATSTRSASARRRGPVGPPAARSENVRCKTQPASAIPHRKAPMRRSHKQARNRLHRPRCSRPRQRNDRIATPTSRVDKREKRRQNANERMRRTSASFRDENARNNEARATFPPSKPKGTRVNRSMPRIPRGNGGHRIGDAPSVAHHERMRRCDSPASQNVGESTGIARPCTYKASTRRREKKRDHRHNFVRQGRAAYALDCMQGIRRRSEMRGRRDETRPCHAQRHDKSHGSSDRARHRKKDPACVKTKAATMAKATRARRSERREHRKRPSAESYPHEPPRP